MRREHDTYRSGRRFFVFGAVACLGALLASAATNAYAQETAEADLIRQAGPTVVFGGPGGGLGDVLKSVLADFTAKTGIQVQYFTGQSADVYGRMLAERGRSSLDIYFANATNEARGIEDGLFQPLDPKIVTNLADLYDIARVRDDLAVRLYFSNLGLVYNKKLFAEKKVPAPSTWEDMWAPGSAGHVIMGDTTSGYTVLYIAYLNKVLGGEEADPTKAIDYIAERKSRLLAVVRTAPERSQLMASGNAWMNLDAGLSGIWDTKQNPDLAFVTPKEGGPLHWNSLALLKGAPNPIGAQLLIKYMLGPDAQAKLARETFVGPANKNVTLDADLAAIVPYGPENIKRFVALDDGAVAKSINRYRQLWDAKVAAR
jgi:putative spermidine/putrescine transport system substrate-binding protein